MESGGTRPDWLRRLPVRPLWGSLLLLALCLVTYLPGLLRLPAVDRTEVIYAETARSMVARGNWLDPRYGEVVHRFRPIGAYWAEAASLTLAGPSHDRDIRVYRLPQLLAVIASVIALYLLALPIAGGSAALAAAGLFAVAPLTVLLSQLAITEGLALLPATVAMLCLMRLYVRPDDPAGPRLALMLWIAVGFGMLLNALQTPILIAATLAALFIFDRDLSWMKRTRPLIGLPLALLIAAPWIYVRHVQDGVPFAGMGWSAFVKALGGSQDMKLRAMPGTFLLAALLGFLPGTALLPPALLRLWTARGADPAARFLFAWIAGYIVYLEALSSKPGTYSVQVMFPAMALAVALLIAKARERLSEGPVEDLRWALMPWPVLAPVLPIALFAGVYIFAREWPSLIAVLLTFAVAAFFYMSARAGRLRQLEAWAVSGIAALSLFAVTLLGAVLPSLDKIWPARQIVRALAGCPAGPVAVLGFNEPTSQFVLQSDPGVIEQDRLRTALVEATPSYIAGEARDPRLSILNRFQMRHPRPVACVEAFNPMRGCPLYFTVVATGDTQGCSAREAFPCTEAFQAAGAAAKARKGCD